MQKDRTETIMTVCDYLPRDIKNIIKDLPLRVMNDMTEIRLRAKRPLGLTLKGENVFLSKNGQVCHLWQQGLYEVTEQEVTECFNMMCDRSVYAFADQIKQGFITLKNGCRAGLAASAVYENGILSGFSKLSSINIRIAAEYKGCAIPLTKYLSSGLLIAGPPSSGKTTVLRDAVRLISDGIGTNRKRVAVIDSRGEIAAVSNGIPQNDVGILTDVISGVDKREGIEIALRTLNPEVIAFDEIGNIKESKAVCSGLFSGAYTVCTVHAGSVKEILHRDSARLLIESGAVEHIAFLPSIGAEPIVLSAEEIIENSNQAEVKRGAFSV